MNLPWNTFESATPTVRPDADLQPVPLPAANKPVILGAGLAGCWLARTLAERGVSVCLIDRHDRVAGGASGNPAGIVKPFVTRLPCDAMRFYALAHDHLLEQLNALPLVAADFRPCGVAQLVLRRYPTSPLYECLDTDETNRRVGQQLPGGSIYFPASGWLNPKALCLALTNHPLIDLRLSHTVSTCERSRNQDKSTGWTLRVEKHRDIKCRHLVLASGESLSMLPETRHLPIVPARGQLSRFALKSAATAPNCVVSGKHYVIPDGQSVLVGASFQRNICHGAVQQHDHELNRQGLSKLLPDLLIDPIATAGHAGVRATTPDRLPVIGPAPDSDQSKQAYAQLHHGKPASHYPPLPTIKGLYVMGGFGSRGIVTAPYGAKLMADYLMGINDMESWAALVNPARFLIRQLKRGIKIS